jgi:hypothetical protein
MEQLFLNSISSSHKVPEKGKEEISWKGEESNGRRHKSE